MTAGEVRAWLKRKQGGYELRVLIRRDEFGKPPVVEPASKAMIKRMLCHLLPHEPVPIRVDGDRVMTVELTLQLRRG